MSCFWNKCLFSYMLFLHLLIIIYHSKTLFSFSVPRIALQTYVPHSLLRNIGHFYSSKLFLCPTKCPAATRQIQFSQSRYTNLHTYTLSLYSTVRQDVKTVTVYMKTWITYRAPWTAKR